MSETAGAFYTQIRRKATVYKFPVAQREQAEIQIEPVELPPKVSVESDDVQDLEQIRQGLPSQEELLEAYYLQRLNRQMDKVGRIAGRIAWALFFILVVSQVGKFWGWWA